MDVIKRAQSLGAEDVVIEILKGETNQMRFANNSISVIQNWQTERMKIFLAWKKRVVRTVVFDLSDKFLDSTLHKLIKILRITKPNLNYRGISDKKYKYKKIKYGYDRRIANLGEDTIDYIDAAMNAALENSKKVAGVLYTNIYDRTVETSSGVDASEKISNISISIRAFNESDESGHGVSCSRILNKFSPETAGEKAGYIAYLAKNPVIGPKGKFDVIFDPMSIANLLSLVGRFASAFLVDTGFSFLENKINKKIFSNKVTLIDAGKLPNGFNSSAFDDEGVPTQNTKFVDKGVLKTYLHNTSTAAKHKTKTTANAGLIAPNPTNIVLKEGLISKEKLFKEVKNGLYITNVWYTRFQNYRTGDFSTIPRDGIFLIKNGEIVKSLKGIRVSDNLERIFRNVSNLSNKSEWVQWWEVTTPVLTPYVLVKNVNITLPTM